MKKFFDDGSIVLFQGDSITDCGRSRENDTKLGSGYPMAVSTLYDYLFPDNEVTFINRGVSGDRMRNLLERYEKDFLAVKPDFVSILIGINDTWRRYDNGDPTSTERYTSEYEELLRRIKKDMPKTKIMIIIPFVLHTLPDRIAWHEDLDPKIIAAYELGKKYADYILPLDSIFEKAITDGDFTPFDISEDGVHPAYTGHALIATEYLKTLKII